MLELRSSIKLNIPCEQYEFGMLDTCGYGSRIAKYFLCKSCAEILNLHKIRWRVKLVLADCAQNVSYASLVTLCKIGHFNQGYVLEAVRCNVCDNLVLNVWCWIGLRVKRCWSLLKDCSNHGLPTKLWLLASGFASHLMLQTSSQINHRLWCWWRRKRWIALRVKTLLEQCYSLLDKSVWFACVNVVVSCFSILLFWWQTTCG